MNKPPNSLLAKMAGGLLVFAALIGFSVLLNDHYPIQRWLFWKYFKAAVGAVFWLASCMATGLAIIQALRPGLPARERLVQAAACGVYAFYVLQFVGGLLGLFGAAWSIALPISMLVFGTLASRGQLHRLWRRRAALRTFNFGSSTTWQSPLVVFGIVCLAGIYLGILTPGNASFDSVWYHLGLGQGWSAEGGIFRSEEGWFVEALPNLAAVLYSWAFLLPTFDSFETLMLVAHMEFALFMVTLAGIPVLVRWLVPDARVGISWVALFLFPSVFIYDAGLHSGNDHIAAFFAVPIFLALRRTWTRLDWRNTTLLALLCSCAILTKYQAASLVAGPALLVVGRAACLAARRGDDLTWFRGLGVAFVAGLVFTSPLWAKNWIWYGDPLFPALHKYLTLTPWNEDMSALVEQNWKRLVKRPEGTLAEQLWQTFQWGFGFSFRSFARRSMHGAMPYFGSLFTLSLLWLPFVKGAKRTWVLFAAAQIGVFAWYLLSHVERYLQALVPWMAAVVAAAIILAWRRGWSLRIPVCALVLLQVIWGGDALFLKSHAMMRDQPIVQTARLIESGFRGNWGARTNLFGAFQTIGQKLPPGSSVLLHEHNPRMGLGSRVVTDMPGFQSRIRYGLLGSPKELYELYDDLGVTHVVWRQSKSRALDSMAGDLRFHEFVSMALEDKSRAGSFALGRLPKKAPDVELGEVVLYAGCGQTFEPGLYHLRNMNVVGVPTQRLKGFAPMPSDPDARQEALARANFVVYGSKCKQDLPRPGKGFIHAADRDKEQLWVRRWPKDQ